MWIFERGIQDGHLADLLERSSVVAQLVQQDAQRPDVTLLVDWLPAPDIYHLGTPILHGSVTLNVVLDDSALLSIGSSRSWRSCTAKITKLVDGTFGRVGDEHVLDLQVSVQERRLEVMHGRNTLADVAEDVQDLWLGQAVLQARVHEVNQTTARAKLHEQKDLVATAFQLTGMAVDVCDNVLVAL